MSTPHKAPNQQTGNSKRLLVVLLLLATSAAILTRLLPQSNHKATNGYIQTTTHTTSLPQVEGAQTAGDSLDISAQKDATDPSEPTTDTKEASYRVVAVSDGDTIKASINGKTETIRLIGVDTPETVDPHKTVQCYGHEASNFTKKTLQDQSVHLHADSSQQDRDKYGRLLRYVFTNDGANFNLLLIQSGYGFEYTYKVPYQYQQQFKNAQAVASNQQVGLWNPSACNGKHG